MKPLMPFLIFTLAISTLVSCKKTDAAGNEIKDFDVLSKATWLLGNWEQKDSLGTLRESWKVFDDSTFVAQSLYIINEKDTVHNEIIGLLEDNGHLVYTTIIKGQNNDEPIPFQLMKETDSLLVFQNPKYDYPTKIEYILNKNNSITARVTRKENGKLRYDSYIMSKAK